MVGITRSKVIVGFLQALKIGKMFEGLFFRRLTSKPAFCPKQQKKATGR